MTYLKKVSILAVAISGVIASAQPAFAQGGESATLEEVVVMGSRSNKARSAVDSTVPVDVFSEAEKVSWRAFSARETRSRMAGARRAALRPRRWAARR